MANVVVSAGICGFTADITAVMNEDEMVEMTVCTTCPNFKKLEKEPTEIDPYGACLAKLGTGEVFDLCRPMCPHNACPIPTAMIKAVEVAAGLALPCDVTMQIKK